MVEIGTSRVLRHQKWQWRQLNFIAFDTIRIRLMLWKSLKISLECLIKLAFWSYKGELRKDLLFYHNVRQNKEVVGMGV